MKISLLIVMLMFSGIEKKHIHDWDCATKDFGDKRCTPCICKTCPYNTLKCVNKPRPPVRA